METAVATALVGRIAPKLLDFLQTNHRLHGELEHDIKYIKSEFVMISAAIREDGDRPPRSGDQVHSAWIQMVRQLAHDIEDCVDRFTHLVALNTVGASWIRRRLHWVKTLGARNKFAKTIRRLRKTSEEASVLRTKYSTNIGGGGGEGGGGSSTSALKSDEEETETETDQSYAVGMEAPRDELMELIRGTSTQGQREELKVISLVGFGGIGKTLLAKHVYDTIVDESEYEARAWVRAAEKGAGDVLKELLRQLGMHEPLPISCCESGSSIHLRKLRASLKECLGTKRFFIVIDDMWTVFWHDIKDAFPVVPGVSSRVMVTTAIQSVANACSSAHGHVYKMTTLAEEHSRQLFLQEASLEDSPPPGDHRQFGTSEALTKCDGLPLALVTTAQFLQSRGDPRKWANLCENLGEHLEREETLASMNRVLVRSYTSLGSQDVKTCLLYLGIYPSGHPIRRGRLIRRWQAEGFVKEDHRRSALSVAVDNFDELVDRSIIQPIDASSSNSIEVKKCQTHGMMLEFILHKSMCENFVTLLYDKDPLPGSNIRWLSLHHKTSARAKMNPKDLRLVRSLTIFGKAHNSMLDFSKYKLLRVLDLEECDEHLENKHLKEICSNLLLLRYLSLGSTVKVTVLPKEIKKLQFLDTLDVRRTKIEILPTQVIELPCLIHLFGKFKLQQNVGSWRMRKLQTWLSENSKLETLAGFVVDEGQELPQLMDHMEHLTKVKIWCESTGADDIASSSLSHLSKSIKGFIARGTNLNEARSLSLNFINEWSQDLLNFSLEEDYSYYLSSLKLQGNTICSLPPFITILGGLTELCLSFPGHKLSGDIFYVLSRVRGLEYLKLIANQLEKLVIGQGVLRSLRHQCIVVEVMTGLEIQEGALPRLESLRLLCKDLNGFRGMTIQSLQRLKEVALHDGVSDRTKHEWTEAAKNHPKRPKLLFVEPAEVVDVESEPASKISPTAPATTKNNTTLLVNHDSVTDAQQEHPVPVITTTDNKILLVNSNAITNAQQEHPVPIVNSTIESKPVAEISVAPATTDNTLLSVNHDAITNAQHEDPVLVLTSETGSDPAVEIPLAPVVTSETRSEPAVEILAAPATTDNMTMSVNHDTVTNAQRGYPAQVSTC